jgi:formamidopyrimidine-DNA glycosylase
MPELPEVETVRTELESKIVGHKITDVFCDWQKLLRNTSFVDFKKEVVNHVIEAVERKGKFIFFRLSGNKIIVFHLRMTGHFIVSSCWIFNGKKIKKDTRVECENIENDIFTDKKNTFIHFAISLNKNRNIMLSDVRKFATIDLIDESQFEDYKNNIGIDALDEKLNSKIFYNLLNRRNIEIKKALLDQKIIAGIGNIYADEILFDTYIDPRRNTKDLTQIEAKKIFTSMKRILKKAVNLGGTSFSDFRNTEGKSGDYGIKTKVYKKKGEKCPRNCGHKINRIIIGGRGTHFCPYCQK